MNYGVSCRCGSDLALLWLRCRLAATAPIRPLAWEPLYALKGQKTKKKKKRVMGPLVGDRAVVKDELDEVDERREREA